MPSPQVQQATQDIVRALSSLQPNEQQEAITAAQQTLSNQNQTNQQSGQNQQTGTTTGGTTGGQTPQR